MTVGKDRPYLGLTRVPIANNGSNHAMRSPSSSRMVTSARLSLSVGVTNCLPGYTVTASSCSSLCPVNGLNRVIRSI